MKHTVEVSTRNSYGGRKFVATVELDAPDADTALDFVIASHGLEGVQLEADTSYSLKCGDVLTTRFGDEFTGSAKATNASTFVEPTQPLTPGKLPEGLKTSGRGSIEPTVGGIKMVDALTPALNDLSDKADGMIARAARLMGITPEALNEAFEQGMSLDTTEMGEQLIDARLIGPPDIDVDEISLIGDEIQIGPDPDLTRIAHDIAFPKIPDEDSALIDSQKLMEDTIRNMQRVRQMRAEQIAMVMERDGVTTLERGPDRWALTAKTTRAENPDIIKCHLVLDDHSLILQHYDVYISRNSAHMYAGN